MSVKLSFLDHPVRDVAAAVAFYRDELGLDEGGAPASGFFQVDDVDEFHRRHADRITFVDEPQDLPPIRYASFRDPDGNLIRLWADLEAPNPDVS